MLSIIAIIPALIAAQIAWTQSVHRAFIYVYVPVLLFLPDYYYWKVPGLPDPNFGTATVLVIAVIWLIRGSSGWKFSFTDLLVFGYAFAVLYSEFLSPEGRPHYQNFIANFIGSVICPYILAKSLIEPAGLGEAFAKSIILTLFLVAGLLVFQFITFSHYTPTQYLLGRFFGQGWRITADQRWGLIRANGPYQHEILAGLVMWSGYRIQRWLEWSQAWPDRLRQFSWFPISIGRVLTLGILVGGLVTLTRGPMMGALVAAFVPLIGLSKRRWTIFWILVAFAILVGIPVLSWFISYASVDPANTETRAHQTVAYRWQLVVDYIDIAMERFFWGWGRFGMPTVGKFQWSIDNYFLLLFLRHGIIALGCFIGIFIIMMVRLFIHSMLQPLPELPGSTLGFTLLSVYILYFIAIATVWMGHQTEPLFFLLVGWSDGYLRSRPNSLGNKATSNLSQKRQPFQFRRIL